MSFELIWKYSLSNSRKNSISKKKINTVHNSTTHANFFMIYLHLQFISSKRFFIFFPVFSWIIVNKCMKINSPVLSNWIARNPNATGTCKRIARFHALVKGPLHKKPNIFSIVLGWCRHPPAQSAPPTSVSARRCRALGLPRSAPSELCKCDCHIHYHENRLYPGSTRARSSSTRNSISPATSRALSP